MLSVEARPYIEASVPVLREHGLTITRTFYENMFREHPELTNLFNMGNQASGAQQQSLAAAVFAYAANIDNAAALGPVVNRIVHKHASVGIKADHYPIVGRHLLGAIQQTLGDAATPPLLEAWDEAYSALANALIDAEKNLYAQANVEPGQLRDMRVIETSQEAEDILSIVMQPLDGQPAPQFKPGQYVSVCVDFGNGRRQMRQYSLSDAPKGDRLRITVKREVPGHETPAGEVSNWLHDNVKRDRILQITHPFGEFTPDTESSAPIVLMAAGVGITPMISALNRIADVNPQRHVIFAFAGRDKAHHAHQADIARAKSVMPNLQVVNFYESLNGASTSESNVHEGLMDVSKLPSWPRNEANVYMCGPTGFMKAQWLSLVEAGVPAANLHREVFGPEMLDYLG
ncbi:NO-inducible flavohemoprotein [Oxalobacteraceae bacterium R-40]|uniref:nitric oxide dioxygenase n=1 Tax=Keguizhuia sedimenti TaxID=3064264 RepID=A0ABU1BKC8_9BURK|nr:NO-inducible flavohemoprotein [Oxalobacteraceae bacterium R-40]